MTTVGTAAPVLGPRIRALREAMDLSLRDLAERSGVSAPMLSQVERGETSPTLQTPPSTYSRPPISTGSNIQGTVHDAATAPATVAAGAPGLPNTTRRPERRSTAVTRSRPSNRAPEAATRSRSPSSVW